MLHRRSDNPKPHPGIALVASALLLLSSSATAQAERSEYEIKAAFLYQLTRYARWSSSNLPKTDKTIDIAVIGKDPFGKKLDALRKTEPVGGRKIAVHRLGIDHDLKGIQMLWVSRSLEDAEAAKLIARARTRGVLTVSDRPKFLECGGVAEVYLSSKKLKFDISLISAGRAKVKLSSKLLKHAKRVIREKK